MSQLKKNAAEMNAPLATLTSILSLREEAASAPGEGELNIRGAIYETTLAMLKS